jgi:NAD(P)-dependent dehydrogenase (short-subunit alcohol dehydrogenase family)
MEIKDSVAIVTGGNRGIGEAFVRELLQCGARRVFIGTRSLSAAEPLSEFGERVVAVKLDVTIEAEVQAAAAKCGDVSILINNAGFYGDRTLIGAEDMSTTRAEMDVNYFGVLSMCRAFAPILKQNGGGSIINVLSSAGIVAAPNMGGYSPSKFAARALTTSVRAELKNQGTHVGALIVGSVETRMSAHVTGKKEPPSIVAKAGMKAIRARISEMDTDAMAIGLRASLARDPQNLEKKMASLLEVESLSTGR